MSAITYPQIPMDYPPAILPRIIYSPPDNLQVFFEEN